MPNYINERFFFYYSKQFGFAGCAGEGVDTYRELTFFMKTISEYTFKTWKQSLHTTFFL